MITLPEDGSTQQLREVRELAVNLMRDHGLLRRGWSFKWDKAKTRAGQTNHARKTISLSAPLHSLWNIQQSREIILHEIAHALLPYWYGHDDEWEKIAKRIGATPTRCWGSLGEKDVPYAYQGICPNGHLHRRHRKTKNMNSLSCLQCQPQWSKDTLIKWKKIA